MTKPDLKDLSKVLKVTRGSNATWLLYIVDENGEYVDMTSVTNAIFTIKQGPEEVAEVIKDTDTIGGLTIVAADSVLQVSITVDESNVLCAGTYIADVALERDSKWSHTSTFKVEVENSLSEVE